jgi:hypothetical protein
MVSGDIVVPARIRTHKWRNSKGRFAAQSIRDNLTPEDSAH